MNQSKNVQISVIVVTYKSASCIEGCVRSVQQQEGVSAEIIVVDNNSTDDTLHVLGRFGSGIQLIVNRANVGFGRGCNQGAAVSGGELLFMLNPDARFEQCDGLALICRAMEQNPRWGLAGTRIRRPDGRLEAPGETQYPEQHRARCDFSGLPGAIAWVVGASMVIRRESFATVGGFDPGFFLYSEETDLCLRLRQKGWEIGYIPTVTVGHIGGESEQDTDPYDMWSRRMTGIHRFWMKHYPARDVRRIVRLDWFRASFRSRWYTLASWFRGSGSRASLKRREYAAIRDTSWRFLTARSEAADLGEQRSTRG